MTSPRARRRAAVLPPGRLTFREIAAYLGISVITLRRRVRPVGDQPTRRLWAQRLDLKRRQRGDSLPVYHACRRRGAEWGAEIAGMDPPVRD
ncbi:hypothetical protein [Gemmatimonas sp.]|uniref:hypothetical protein n=1 Tax=Gemmatimonas sp. TaxID=1962908 RepID=UPI0037C1940E